MIIVYNIKSVTVKKREVVDIDDKKAEIIEKDQ